MIQGGRDDCLIRLEIDSGVPHKVKKGHIAGMNKIIRANRLSNFSGGLITSNLGAWGALAKSGGEGDDNGVVEKFTHSHHRIVYVL